MNNLEPLHIVDIRVSNFSELVTIYGVKDLRKEVIRRIMEVYNMEPNILIKKDKFLEILALGIVDWRLAEMEGNRLF